MTSVPVVERVRVRSTSVPTDTPEADGTLAWDATTVVAVEVDSGGLTGLGVTYGPTACAAVVHDLLAEVVRGRSVHDIPGTWSAMVRAIRNAGRPGVVSMALSALDIALWDLKAKVLGLPLTALLGAARERVPMYGSSSSPAGGTPASTR